MPLLWLSLAFLCGVLLGEYLGWSWFTWGCLGVCTLLIPFMGTLLRRFHIHITRFTTLASKIPFSFSAPVPYWLILLSLVFGALRYETSQPEIDQIFIAWYNDLESSYVVEGVLVKPPDTRDNYSNLKVEVEQIHPIGEPAMFPVRGKILAKVSPGDDWHYGDRLRLEGNLQTPPEDEIFSYREYLARQGIYSYLSYPDAHLSQRNQGHPALSSIYTLKREALEVVYRLYPDPEASLMAGILLGVESGIPEDVDQAFRDTGTSHVIAISGFNITIIAGLLAVVFGRLIGRGRVGARWGALIALVGIAIYTLLVGADAAVVRAAIMGGFALFAMQVGRRQDGLNSLAFVAALMALINPNVLWDVGFQLSFAATLGLIVYAEPLTNIFLTTTERWVPPETARRISAPVAEYLLFTFAASLMTLPITLYHFQRLSLTSLLANPMILPAQPPLMIIGGISVILGLIYQPLGQLVAYLAWPFVVYTIRIVELFARIPSAAITVGKISMVGVIGFYVLLLGWTFSGERIKSWFVNKGFELPSRAWLFATALLVISAVIIWQAALSAPDGNLHLTLLDVGTGDGILIQSPTGRYVLIDGGPSPSRLSDALGRRFPLTQREIDWLVVAAAGEEQLAALPSTVLRFPPSSVLWSGPVAGSRSARFLRERLVEDDIPITLAKTGNTLDLGKGATLQILADTARGAVLLLEWGRFRALLPIGIDFEHLETLSQRTDPTSVTALLMAESGYAPVNTNAWIKRWDPEVILLSVGAGDLHGLPDQEALSAVEGYPLLRTDLNGWIHISTDGERMWVEVEK